ncbi:MAG: transposase [Candidatus Accumulibacter necessarius]|uniref:transposase n=1 Tax=Candidatus Accumulibacter necessarius TaxID=2954386 RepID=UPI002FC354B9
MLLCLPLPEGWLFAALLQRGRHFCMRADSLNFIAIQAFRRSDRAEQVVTLPTPCKQDALDYEIAATPCEVRLIRHVFGHKVRVLVTSLLNLDAYPAGDFGALYHSRWRIEEALTRIKHRLALEQLSGLSWLATQQDFGARILCDNLNALAVHAASEFLDPNISALLHEPGRPLLPHQAHPRTLAPSGPRRSRQCRLRLQRTDQKPRPD